MKHFCNAYDLAKTLFATQKSPRIFSKIAHSDIFIAIFAFLKWQEFCKFREFFLKKHNFYDKITRLLQILSKNLLKFTFSCEFHKQNFMSFYKKQRKTMKIHAFLQALQNGTSPATKGNTSNKYSLNHATKGDTSNKYSLNHATKGDTNNKHSLNAYKKDTK